MKKFAFTLESLQNTKLMQEREIRKEMAAIENQLKEQQLVLECLEEEMACVIRAWQSQMGKGLNALSLQQFNNSFLQLREQKVKIQNTGARIEQEKSIIQERLISLMTEIKGLDKLREQQLEQYRLDLAREMENEISEFVVSRRQPVMTV